MSDVNSVEQWCKSLWLESVGDVCVSDVNSVEQWCKSLWLESVGDVCVSDVNSVEQWCKSLWLESVGDVCVSDVVNSVEQWCKQSAEVWWMASLYNTRLSWAHTPVINWAVCVEQ